MQKTQSESFFALSSTLPSGKPFPLESLKGKVVLVVNTATKCGLTPQFEGLEKLHQSYKEQGLAVLGFPCDQFAHQEPHSDDEMEQVCRVNHGVTFPLMAKSEVNGPNTNAVFQFLKDKSRGLFGIEKAIEWNFGKFLVSKDGTEIVRFSPTTVPADLEAEVVRLLR